jgi:hypothetical protein
MPHLPHLPALAVGFSHFMGHSYIVAAVLGAVVAASVAVFAASVAVFAASVAAFGASAFGTATFSTGNAVVFVGVAGTSVFKGVVAAGVPVVFGASSHETMKSVAKPNNLNNFISVGNLILMKTRKRKKYPK